MNRPDRLVVVPVLALAALFVLPTVGAAPPRTPTTAVHGSVLLGAWAYGGNRSFSGSGAARNGTYSIQAFFGYSVLLNETSAGGGITTINAVRTMGASYTLSYCEPSCAHPLVSAAVTFRAAERFVGAANLTNHSAVLVSGTSVPAVGLVNASTRSQIAEWENDTVTARGLVTTRTAHGNFSLQIDANIGVTLTPALGLVPLAPTAGTSWTSGAAFVGSGNWNSVDSAHRTSMMGITASGGRSLSFNLSRSGNISLLGTDAGEVTLTGGARADVIGLTFQGPLRAREGFFLLPAAADLLGAAPIPNAPGGNGSMAESPGAIDFVPGLSGHLGLLASATDYSASGQDPGQSSGPMISPAVEGSGPVTVQAEPEPLGSARSNQACLWAGSCVGAGGAPPPNPFVLRPLAVVALGGVSVLAAVGAVAVVRRPKVPPRPNETLYPRVRAESGDGRPPPTAPAAARTEATPETDPLRNLW